MTIQEHCSALNISIHKRIFLTNFLQAERNHERAFTSIDVIEDCQDAIDEFVEVERINRRSTLYIYGVLQAMYCQQDGLFQLYKTIVDGKIKNVYELFKLNEFPNNIREVRDDIAGHPVDRKNGKEFYFIAKGTNAKYKFTYAGYTPEFRQVDVDLQNFISIQANFCLEILILVDKAISSKIKTFKEKFKGVKLINLLKELDRHIQLVYRGIHDNHPMASLGQKEMQNMIDKVKLELNKRYPENIPETIDCIFRLQQHSTNKIEEYIRTKNLHKNIDAEIYMDSFKCQVDELKQILVEIDEEFQN